MQANRPLCEDGRLRAKPSTTEADWLLERQEALGRLHDSLAAARDEGRGALAVVSGVAGVGKSALLGVAEREARARGWQVLSACGDDLERGFAFGVAIQLFAENVLARVDREPELLAGAAALARPLLERAAPEVRPGDPDPAFPLLHGLHWLAVNLSERAPLLLSVDDAHWADAQTLRFLLYLAQRAGGVRLAILLARRSGERPDPEGAALLERLEAQAGTLPLALGPLGCDSVRELVRRRLPRADEAFAAACFEASGGNPFLLGELLREAAGEAVADASRVRALRPASIRRSILGRLARLGEVAEPLAQAVALLGEVPLDLAAELAGLDTAAAAHAADRLAEAGILEVGARLGFVHPLLRDAVYQALPEARRRLRHAAAARLLHGRASDPAAVASHLALCDPLGEAWVVVTLRQAAQIALGLGAARTALAHLRRALREPGGERDPELLLELGMAEAGAGEPAWEDHLEAATRLLSDPDRRRQGLAALGYGRWLRGDPAAGLAAVESALAGITPGRGGTPEAELLWGFFVAGRYTPAFVGAVRELLAIERLGPGGIPTPGEVMRRVLCALDLVLTARPGAAELSRTALAWVRANPELAAEVPALLDALALALTFVGDCTEADPLLEPALDLGRKTGDRQLLGATLEVRTYARSGRGDLRGALTDAETVLALCDAWDLATIPTRCVYAELLLERGEPESASRALRAAGEVEARLAGHPGLFLLPAVRARVALACGQGQEALAQARLAGEWAEAADVGGPDWLPWRSLAARAAHGLGQREGALALVAEELDLARKIGSPRAAGVALVTLGTLQGGARGLESLREAVELLDTSEAGLEQARARLALGSALRRLGQRREARELLKEAAQRARAMGATAMAETALTELHVAGGRPRRLQPTGVEALTPGQLRVAQLAAAGQSNKEIAQSLFVTLRTVETHLTEVYRRLEIGSRERLADALRAATPDPRPAPRR